MGGSVLQEGISSEEEGVFSCYLHRLLTDLTTQPSSTTAQWDSNKTTLPDREEGKLVIPLYFA